MSQKIKNCLHCLESFEATRKNNTYCSNSCVVRACYARKGYAYVSGRYVKPEENSYTAPGKVSFASIELPKPTAPVSELAAVERQEPEKKGGITLAGVLESAVGVAIVEMAKLPFKDLDQDRRIRELHQELLEKPRREQQELKRQKFKEGLAQRLKARALSNNNTNLLNNATPLKINSGMGGEWM